MAALLSFAPPSLRAQTAASKIAPDLQQIISAASTPKISFAKDVRGQRHVKALVVASSSDPDLTELRAAVLAAGGSVYMRYVSVAALSVLLPANQVAAIAARSDVQGISPNRLTARTSSALEEITGATNVRSYSGNSLNYSGLDGSGVGIAVLDSGIDRYHSMMYDARARLQRVKAAVDFQKVGDATALGTKDWTPGLDTSAALYPGSNSLAAFESKISSM